MLTTVLTTTGIDQLPYSPTLPSAYGQVSHGMLQPACSLQVEVTAVGAAGDPAASPYGIASSRSRWILGDPLARILDRSDTHDVHPVRYYGSCSS